MILSPTATSSITLLYHISSYYYPQHIIYLEIKFVHMCVCDVSLIILYVMCHIWNICMHMSRANIQNRKWHHIHNLHIYTYIYIYIHTYIFHIWKDCMHMSHANLQDHTWHQIHAYIFTYICIHTYIYSHVAYTYTYTYMYSHVACALTIIAYLNIKDHRWHHIHTYLFTHIYIYTYTYIYIFARDLCTQSLHTWTYKIIRDVTSTHIYLHIYIYTYIYSHVPTYTLLAYLNIILSPTATSSIAIFYHISSYYM